MPSEDTTIEVLINEPLAWKLFEDGWITCKEGHWTQSVEETEILCPSCDSPLIRTVEELLDAQPPLEIKATPGSGLAEIIHDVLQEGNAVRQHDNMDEMYENESVIVGALYMDDDTSWFQVVIESRVFEITVVAK